MSIKDKIRLAPRVPLEKSLTRLRLYSGEWMNSMGVYSTQCVVRVKAHSLDNEKPEALAFRGDMRETWPDTFHHPCGAEQSTARQVS